MRTILKILGLIIFCLLPKTVVGQTMETISQETALEIVQKQFSGQDVDFFLKNDPHSDVWTILVDAEPETGNPMEYYTLVIPKEIPQGTASSHSPTKARIEEVPSGDFSILATKNRYNDNAYVKPAVKKATLTSEQSIVARRTYAIIINGGVDKLVNRERYWNDCSFIYQTLVNTYGIPKDNIFPLMSDGNDPAEDMIRADNHSYCSQPLDLDFDGDDEIKLAATKDNLKAVVQRLLNNLSKDDHLFVFVMDHGGCDKLTNNITHETKYLDSYICLWGDSKDKSNRLYHYELKDLLSPFSERLVNINVVLGQCHAGGFIESLGSINCVVSTACKKEEYSNSCKNLPYDEFVYHWISAINSATPDGNSVNADNDNSGHITMDEAFAYAQRNDKRRETPQFSSTPYSIGEDLAFSRLPEAVDLYIKDCNLDTGKEPNRVTKMFWISPYIWIRNQNDSIHIHENPVLSPKHNTAYVYVKIDNRGKSDFDGNGKWVHLYWANAATGLSTETWKGLEYHNNVRTGGHYGSRQINPIAAGESGFVMFELNLNETATTIGQPTNKHHLCLFAKIMDQPNDDGYTPGMVYFEQWNSNDQAQRNISVVDQTNLNGYTNIYMRNPATLEQQYSLEFIPASPFDKRLFSKCQIEMTLPNEYNLDLNNSIGVTQIKPTEESEAPIDTRRVAFISPNNKLEGIRLDGKELITLGIKFRFTDLSPDNNPFTLHLVQRDVKGQIIGGETFIVTTPIKATSQLQLTTANTLDGTTVVTAGMEDLHNISWYDHDLNLISEATTISRPLINIDTQLKAIGQNINGELACAIIKLSPQSGISDIEQTSNGIRVTLRGNIIANSDISIVSVNDGSFKARKTLSSNETIADIDLPSNTNGIHLVSYCVNGDVIDCKKVTLCP